jgi:hypothetical protein
VISHPAYRGTWFGEGEVKAHLDRPENNLPALAPAELRVRGLRENVWGKAKARQ